MGGLFWASAKGERDRRRIAKDEAARINDIEFVVVVFVFGKRRKPGREEKTESMYHRVCVSGLQVRVHLLIQKKSPQLISKGDG